MSRNIAYKILDTQLFMYYFKSALEGENMKRKSTKRNDLSRNLKLYYMAIGVIILGYFFLSIGDADSFTSITLGPIVIVLGYIVAVPFALLSGIHKKEDNTVSEELKNPQRKIDRKKTQ